MILRRLGNKSKLAKDIVPYFLPHKCYIELFFGSGGLCFNKHPKAQYNFLNDIDSNVQNCFNVLRNNKDELINYVELAPVSTDFWNECKEGDFRNDIEKAVYFLFLSNFGFIGQSTTLRVRIGNDKAILLQNIEKTFKQISKNGNWFLNCDFRDVLSNVGFRNGLDKAKTFIYSDPPYFEKGNNYACDWTEKDVIDCFDVTFDSGFSAAMSEFNHPFIVEQAKKRGLRVIEIGERRNIKDRATEVLILNYDSNLSLF
jgi:DNA adenine methylase